MGHHPITPFNPPIPGNNSMKTHPTTIKISDTRQPVLTRAVINALGGIESARESMPDIVNHGVDGGFSGFIYYSDTVKFAARHKAAILERLKEDASNFGDSGVISMLAGFNCFKGMSQEEIADGLYNPRSDNRTTIYNGLAWYACEEIAREMNPALTQSPLVRPSLAFHAPVRWSD